MVNESRLWFGPIALLCALSHSTAFGQDPQNASPTNPETIVEKLGVSRYEVDLLKSHSLTALEWSTLQLTHPQFGVYGSGNVVFGGQPKRVTKDKVARSMLATGSPEPPPTFNTDPRNMSPVFGSLMAVRLFQLWLDTPKAKQQNPFYLIEMGGGTGRLAHDILTFIRNGPHREETESDWQRFYRELRYLGIDISGQYVQEQNQVNSRFVEEGRFLAVQGDASNLPEHRFFSLSDEERERLFAGKGKRTIEAEPAGQRPGGRGLLNPVIGIFLSNEFPDILPFHLIRTHRDRARPDELVGFIPILPEETYSRIRGLLRYLASQNELVVVVEEQVTRPTVEDLEQLFERARLTSDSLRDLCDTSRRCIREPAPVDYPPLQAGVVYLGKAFFSTILAALSDIRNHVAIPVEVEEALPAAKLPSRTFISAAAEEAELDLAEQILLELIWHVGFQPVALPLQAISPELPELQDPLFSSRLETMKALLVDESQVFFWPSAQIAWIEGLSRVLRRGYVVTTDYWADLQQWYYGIGPIQRYFTPLGRQQVDWNPEEARDRDLWHYLRFGLGFYDVTTGAHFANLAQAGSRAGLELAAYESQESFLARPDDEQTRSEIRHYYDGYQPQPDSGVSAPYDGVLVAGGAGHKWVHEWRLFGPLIANPGVEPTGTSGRYTLVQRKGGEMMYGAAFDKIAVHQRQFAIQEEALAYLDDEWDRSVARRLAEPDLTAIRGNLENLKRLREN